MVHAGGRPPEYDLVEQANALEKWSKTDNATALVQFCNLQDIEPSYVYIWRDKSPEFCSALKKAKSRISERLRNKLHDKQKPYNYGLFMAEIGFHDQFHHEYTESIKDSEAKRRKDIEGAKQSTYNIMVPHDLSVGANISASPLSNSSDKSSE